MLVGMFHERLRLVARITAGSRGPSLGMSGWLEPE